MTELEQFLKATLPVGYSSKTLSGGRNNKALCYFHGEKKVFVKSFLAAQKEDSERFSRELQFYKYCQEQSINHVPRLLSFSPKELWLSLEMIEGERLRAVDKDSLEAAASFIVTLNPPALASSQAHMPYARDSSKNNQTRLQQLETRLTGLKSIEHIEAKSFLEKKLKPKITEWSGYESSKEQEILSPSDFGFHNCLRAPGNRFTFYDFEYSGRDSLLKMCCDFFCQPDVPTPEHFIEDFLKALSSINQNSYEELSRDVLLSLPLFRMKWCCILLNGFRPEIIKRQRFSGEKDTNFKEKLARVEAYFQQHLT